ncbi:MoaA/NifB/PqqE/SkfB family radical SAM enzyme [Novosphingobium sp. PhB165]|uniref:radical SAM protein n=1 Tax=Novosphingobium sp. PhB165 TaxID=2485105 RepID=UPI00104BA1FF|nr:radical SAM protein [Novosphingobium sp. PhB165]TCM20364.1 MoaA/NifB/PqqE/SkfB family radical SAM enzyme [Novosphingobium sp. PhB165]
MDAPATLSPEPVRPGARFIPGIVDLSVTDYCNADCSFCGFARSKMKRVPRRFVDADGVLRALPILKRRGIAYINFQGGEPLLHPRMIEMVAAARAIGMKPSLITNGWKLPEKAEALAKAGLQNLLVSIDSHDLAAHEANRGLRNLTDRIARGIVQLKARGVPVMASVTVNKLVDFAALPDTLRQLGFDAVTFSYPRKDPFGSSSLVYDEDSDLVDYSEAELLAALDAILEVKKRFPVLNPTASVRDIQRHVMGKPERFACVGGFKYFYMDWNLDIWRCEAWHAPLGSVFEFDHMPDDRSPCTACIMSCYRDTSTLMHAGVAVDAAGRALAEWKPMQAARTLLNRAVAQSLGTTMAEAGLIVKLGLRKGKAVRTP